MIDSLTRYPSPTSSALPASSSGCTLSSKTLVLTNAPASVGRATRTLRIPVVAFDRREQITGVRKRRHPAARVQLRVPADVVDVQMRADDDVDVIRCEARSRHPRQERRVETAEDRNAGPLLGVACPRVVQDLEAVDLEDPALQERVDAVRVVAVVLRRQPRREAAKGSLVIADEKHRGWQEIPLPLLDVMHPHVADAQHRDRSPPAVRS